jgi:hypothetical protein
VSFDLYVFDLDEPPIDPQVINDLLEDESGWGHELTSRLAAFVADLESSYPGLDADPDGSPWSTWPLAGNSMASGRVCAFNIRWSAAETMSGEIRERAQRHGLVLYDPQTGDIVRPASSSDGQRRGLFRRKRSR